MLLPLMFRAGVLRAGRLRNGGARPGQASVSARVVDDSGGFADWREIEVSGFGTRLVGSGVESDCDGRDEDC